MTASEKDTGFEAKRGMMGNEGIDILTIVKVGSKMNIDAPIVGPHHDINNFGSERINKKCSRKVGSR